MTFICSSRHRPWRPPQRVQGVVVATGMETRIGEIAKMMASEDKEAMEAMKNGGFQPQR
jgi:magnesium-transporting ATPase (P-type)